MTTLAGFATSVNPLTEVITAYAAAPYQPAPVPNPSPFVVIGSFTLPADITARISVIGLVTGSATCTVAIYDPTQIGSVVLSSSQEQAAQSAPVQFQKGTVYQIAVQFEGPADASNIAVVRTVQLVP